MTMASRNTAQRGGFALGMVLGVLLGLALALGVALYISKVPVPFVDKVPQRTAEQDAAEAERNRHWDPNAPLGQRPPPRPGASGPVGPLGGPGGGVGAAAPAFPPPLPAASQPLPPMPPLRGASAPPAGRSASDVSAKPGADPFTYFVQVAAYARSEEAEQLRARLALTGLGARVTEREQAGRVMYRVRLGPYEVREDAEKVKQQAADAGYPDAALVRVNR
jgi:cell division protein FtsN